MSTLRKLNCYAGKVGAFLQPLILLALRLFWGYALFWSGVGKWQNWDKTVQFFTSLDIPMPVLSAYMAASVECLCGTLLFVGLFSRLAAIPVVILLVTAYAFAHFDAVRTLLQNPQHFVDQEPFLFLLTALVVWAFGPGLFSLDRILCKTK